MAARYRKFMKLCEEWPLDPSKSGRDLGAYVRKKVFDTFKQGETTAVNAKECDEMYDALHKINTNYFKEKYSRTKNNGCSGYSAEECKVAVSNESLTAKPPLMKWKR